MDYFIAMLLGLIVGVVAPLFGMGGGVALVPLLPLLFGLTQLQAMATSLLTIFLVCSWNSWHYQRQGLLSWQAAWPIALSSALTAFMAVKVALLLPTRILIVIFACITFFLAIKVLLFKPQKFAAEEVRQKPLIGALIGLFSGAVAGFAGIGGGGVNTPLMIISRLTADRKAAPTSNLIMVFTSLSGAISFFVSDLTARAAFSPIKLKISVAVFMGAIISSFLGYYLNKKIDPKLRRRCLALLLLLISLKMFLTL